MKSILIIFFVGILLKSTDSRLSNFEQCPTTIATPEDLTKDAGPWYQILRSKTYDAGKCYFWTIIVNKNNQVTINQTARYMNTPTTQTFKLAQNKNGTYQVNYDTQPANNQYFFKVGSFIVSYVCQKNSAIIVLPGVYTNKKTNLTSADITSLTTALQKNGIAFKTDVTKLNVPSCKYTLT